MANADTPPRKATGHGRGANIDPATVEGFGEEWAAFDQTELGEADHEGQFNAYFGILPFASLPADAEGFDLGCGSGRWASRVAERVGNCTAWTPRPRRPRWPGSAWRAVPMCASSCLVEHHPACRRQPGFRLCTRRPPTPIPPARSPTASPSSSPTRPSFVRMVAAGLADIRFSNRSPLWVACSPKKG